MPLWNRHRPPRMSFSCEIRAKQINCTKENQGKNVNVSLCSIKSIMHDLGIWCWWVVIFTLPRRKSAHTHWTGGWVATEPVWTLWRREKSCSARNGSRDVYPVARRCTDRAWREEHVWGLESYLIGHPCFRQWQFAPVMASWNVRNTRSQLGITVELWTLPPPPPTSFLC
jgi:hypothetical protein